MVSGRRLGFIKALLASSLGAVGDPRSGRRAADDEAESLIDLTGSHRRAGPAPPPPPPVSVPPDPEVARSLTSSEVTERKRALLALLREPPSGAAISAAALALRDPEDDLRLLALEVLARSPENAPIDALRAAALDWDPRIRIKAVALLGRTRRPDIVDVLCERLEIETDRAVLEACLGALAVVLQASRRSLSPELIDRVLVALTHINGGREHLRSDIASIARSLRVEDIAQRARSADESVREGAQILARERTTPGRGDRRGRSRAADGSRASTVPRGERREEEIFMSLIADLDTTDEGVRSRATAVLETMDRGHLTELLRGALTGSTSLDRGSVAHLVVRLNLNELVGDLMAAVLASSEGKERERMAEALARLDATWEEIDTKLASSSAEARAEAVRLVGLIAPARKDLLLAALADPSAAVRLAAVESCSLFDDEEVVARLQTQIDRDTSPKVRMAAVSAFERAPAKAREAAADLALDSEDARVRAAALALVQNGNKEDLPYLARALHDADFGVAHRAIEILRRLPDLEVVALLWSSLRSVRPEVQEAIVDSLVLVGNGGVSLLARQALHSSDPGERALALSVLAGIDRDAQRLTDALEDPAPEVRLAALDALLRDPQPAVVDAVGVRLRDPETRVRAKAIEVLRQIEDDRALPYFLDGARDPSREVRDLARAALLSYSSSSVVDLLLRALRFPTHRRPAMDLLIEIGEPATERLLEALGDADPDVRKAIGTVLGATDISKRLVRDLEDRSAAVRRRAVIGLGAVSIPGAVAALIARLDDPDPEVRAAAARVLGEGRHAAAVEPLKQAFVSDPDMSVVAAIEDALRRLTAPPEAQG